VGQYLTYTFTATKYPRPWGDTLDITPYKFGSASPVIASVNIRWLDIRD